MRRSWLLLIALPSLLAAGQPSLKALLQEAGPAHRPRVVIAKGQRQLQVLAGKKVLRSYSCVFGREPLEDKQREGDHRTPRGTYVITDKNAKSLYHLFLGLSYPSAVDARKAAAAGRFPAARAAEIERAERGRKYAEWPRRFWYTSLGGTVGIHGLPGKDDDARLGHDIQQAGDWTWGCISVLNRDIEELFAALPVGTVVEITR